MITGISIIISILIWLVLIGMSAYGEHNANPRWHESVGYLMLVFSSLGFIYLSVKVVLLKLLELLESWLQLQQM